MNPKVFSKTPLVTVVDNRDLPVREIIWHRHPDTPHITDERITRHQFNAQGYLMQSADPRLHVKGRSNIRQLPDLSGSVLQKSSTDAGTTVTLNDAAGRPFIAVSNILTADDGTEDRSQAVTRIWQYEGDDLPGRPLSVTEQLTGEAARVIERFVYAGYGDAEKALNLAGQCISHYDTAGLLETRSIALTGVPLSVTRRLLKDADSPDALADWQGADASAWNDLLGGETCTTLTTADATGAMLTTTDAAGNLQRVAYDVAGLLSASWLTLKGGAERVIVRSLTYSAAGQKLREVHGNGVVTTYAYEPETQRLTGIKTWRPAGHAAGTKVLQDLRYEYDPVGNVLKVTSDAEQTRFWRNQKVVPENVYIYDSLYQLVSATGREMADAGQQGSSLPPAAILHPTDNAAYTNYTRTYNYDRAGNLTQVRHSAPATGNRYTMHITVSDRSNRGVLSTLTESPAEVDALFTAGGQQTQLMPGQSLGWTPRSELLRVTPVARDGGADDGESYRYDAASQRVLKVSRQKAGGGVQTQRVVYLPGLELRTTSIGKGETERLQVICVGEAGRAQVRVLHWEGGKPDGVGNDQARWSYDGLTGSSGLELDGDGNIISMEEYYPYGGTAILAARSRTEADYKTVRYSGKERDATGLYYYGYRYYQPWAGRWLSADPAGTIDGLNLYRMVRNNPVTLRDSDGRFPGLNLLSSAGRSPSGGGQSAAGPIIGVGIRLFLDAAIAGFMAGAISAANDAIYGTNENGDSLAPDYFSNPLSIFAQALTPVVQEYTSSLILSFLPEYTERPTESGRSDISWLNGNARANVMVPLNMAGNYFSHIAGHYAGDAMGGASYLNAGASEFLITILISGTESALLRGFFGNNMMIAPGVRRDQYRENLRGEARERGYSALIDIGVDIMVEGLSQATENPFLTNLPNALAGVIGYLPETASRRRRFLLGTPSNAQVALFGLGQLASPQYRGIPTISSIVDENTQGRISRRSSSNYETQL